MDLTTEMLSLLGAQRGPASLAIDQMMALLEGLRSSSAHPLQKRRGVLGHNAASHCFVSRLKHGVLKTPPERL